MNFIYDKDTDMSENPLISVILPSYNHAEFVAMAVESVLAQTVKDLELIVVDDGSNDGTPDIVARISDPRLRLIRMSQNRIQHPRNLALGLARGKYIAFQNSDDMWLPEKLETQLEVMKEREEVLVCFTDVRIIDHQGKHTTNLWAQHLFIADNRSNLQWLRYFFETGNCLCISSALVRREAIEQAGRFTGSFIQISDFELWVRLAALGEFYVVQKKLTCFRDTTGHNTFMHGSGNLSGPGMNGQNRSVIEFAKLLENYVEYPIVNILPQIFTEIVSVEPDTKEVHLAQLVKYAWSLNTVLHSLFADSVISRIMEDESARKKVTDYFGAEIIQEFVTRRGNLEIRFADQLAAQLADKDQTINAILHSRSWMITYPFRIIGTTLRKLKNQFEKLYRH